MKLKKMVTSYAMKRAHRIINSMYLVLQIAILRVLMKCTSVKILRVQTVVEIFITDIPMMGKMWYVRKKNAFGAK